MVGISWTGPTPFSPWRDHIRICTWGWAATRLSPMRGKLNLVPNLIAIRLMMRLGSRWKNILLISCEPLLMVHPIGLDIPEFGGLLVHLAVVVSEDLFSTMLPLHLGLQA